MRTYLILFVVVVSLTIFKPVDTKHKQAKDQKNSASLSLLALKKHLVRASTNMQVTMPKLQSIVNFNLTLVFVTRKKLQKLNAKLKKSKLNKGKAKIIKNLKLQIKQQEKLFDKTKNRIAVFRALKKVMFKLKTDSLEAYPQIKKLKLIKDVETKKLDKALDKGLKKMFGDSDKMKLHRRLSLKNLDKVVNESRSLIGKLQVGDMVFTKIKMVVLLYHRIVKKINSFTLDKNYYQDSSEHNRRTQKLVKSESEQTKVESQSKKIEHLNKALNFIDKKATRLAIDGGKRVNIKVTAKANICYNGCQRKPTGHKTTKPKKQHSRPPMKRGPLVNVKSLNQKFKTDIPENRRVKQKKKRREAKVYMPLFLRKELKKRRSSKVYVPHFLKKALHHIASEESAKKMNKKPTKAHKELKNKAHKNATAKLNKKRQSRRARNSMKKNASSKTKNDMKKSLARRVKEYHRHMSFHAYAPNRTMALAPKKKAHVKKIHKKKVAPKKHTIKKAHTKAHGKKHHFKKLHHKKSHGKKSHHKKSHRKKTLHKKHKKGAKKLKHKGPVGGKNLMKLHDNIFATQKKLKFLLNKTRRE